MIPLKDNIPSRTIPIVNYLMIACCSLAFLAQLWETAPEGASLVERYGMIPRRVFHPDEPIESARPAAVVDRFGRVVQIVDQPYALAEPVVWPWMTLLSCIFLHGGWMHFLGNMWFLYIFGDNVEDRVGHVGYLLFYLFCGVAASVAHLLTNPGSTVPTIGASGAIAGVMGAYMLLYPRAQVISLIPIFMFIQIAVLPAPLFLGIWFVIQFFQGVLSVTATQAGGVAWWAHIGGFAMGYGIALLLRAVGETRPPVEQVRARAGHAGIYRYRS